jgi:hypothetical protein
MTIGLRHPGACGLFLRGQAALGRTKKQPRQRGTIAVESERITWGELDAPYQDNATDPKRLHVDPTFFCTRFGSGESPLPAPGGSRGGNIASVPQF